jgi:hypothetical protein
MHTEPLAFFTEDYPALFSRGVAELDARAAAGDLRAKAVVADARAARGAVRLTFEGEGGGELWLVVEGGAMRAERTAPADVPVRIAVALPVDIARGGLRLLAERAAADDARAPVAVARGASAKIEKLLSKEKLSFHVVVKDVPEVDTVTVRVAVGLPEIPPQPGFTAHVSYDDLEEVREGALTPQQLLFKKVRFVGDASRAMALAMSMISEMSK